MTYKQIITGDTSITLYNEQYQEHYHTITGAVEEAFEKFAIPCLKDKIKQKKISILDVCFGIGYNSLAAIHYIRKNNPNCRIALVGLENDKNVLLQTEKIIILDFLKTDYDIIRQLAAKKSYKDKNLSAKLLIGDARKTIKNIKKRFDAVFLDPFSPKKCPELWTEKFFKDIHALMKKDAVLATYSCAGVVRKNLKKAGFKVEDGPVVGRRSPGTLAKL